VIAPCLVEIDISWSHKREGIVKNMKKIIVIAGPTASGKSALGLEQAVKTGGVIINADSMQIYNALPLLTARPSSTDLSTAPHRLYGLLPPSEKCSAARWRDLAVAEIKTCFIHGLTPIIVGGTGFYIDSLLNGLSPVPNVPDAFRNEAVALQAELGNPAFHARLAERDPIMAGRLHSNDTQRLVRAYEVFRATGQSLAAWQAAPREGVPADWGFHVTLILPERDRLYARCNARFDLMMKNDALEETAAFMCKNHPADAPVTHALGFRPLSRHLEGKISLDEAVTLAKTETRQYAKRQMTWFRHQIRPASHIVHIEKRS
jgi:tRNA dimethylallyltransferase